MAIIDLAGFVSQLKDHFVEHKFHIHEERHMVETYSLIQSWEIDLHPETACNGAVDLIVSMTIDPRSLLFFEDKIAELEDSAHETDASPFEIDFAWSLPPIKDTVNILSLTLDLTRFGDLQFPIEVGVRDDFKSVTDSAVRHLLVSAKHVFSLNQIYNGEEVPCEVVTKAFEISSHLLDRSAQWLTSP